MAELFGLSDQDAETSGLEGYRRHLALGAEAGSVADAALLADQAFYLPGDMLQKVDRMSMAASLEIRVPFLDRRMMDLAGRIDLRLLTPWLPPDKRVLRELLRRWGGSAEVAGAAKRGFNVPLAAMLRGPLKGLGERYLDRQADALEPHLAPSAVRRLWTEHLTGRRNHGYAVWSLLVFAIWFSDVVMENRDAE
jgi:asparagine synthase (glutamine-hydrolysing)